MDDSEKERLIKAEQTASLLFRDLQDIYKTTDSVPLEAVILAAMQQVYWVRCRLRLSQGTTWRIRIVEKENTMDKREKERLTKAEQAAGLLASDLKDIVTRTDNLPLEEIMIEAIEQVEKVRRRLKRFAGK
jgi:hypothetical protein